MEKAECLKQFKELEKQDQASPPSKEMKLRREELQKNYMGWLKLEEASWRQKARMDWLRFGDINSKFFHQMATTRKRKNSIASLRVGNTLVNGQQQIALVISQFYTDLFMDPVPNRPRLEGLIFNSISEEKAMQLERPVTEKEVLDALKSL